MVSASLTEIEMEFDEFIDPGSVNHTNFEVYIQQFGNLRSVVSTIEHLQGLCTILFVVDPDRVD